MVFVAVSFAADASRATAMMDPVTAFAAGVPAFVAATFAAADVVRRSPAATVLAAMLTRAGPWTMTCVCAPTAYVTPGWAVRLSDGDLAATTPRTVLSLTVVVVVQRTPVVSVVKHTTSPGASVPAELLTTVRTVGFESAAMPHIPAALVMVLSGIDDSYDVMPVCLPCRCRLEKQTS